MAYEITRGAQTMPVKAVCYGIEGVGKTTFAAQWPNAVFIDVEDGSGHYDVARMPRPETWLDLLAEVEAASLMAEVGTLVIDTLDAAESLCVKHLLTKHKADGIESVAGGYGKGYTYLAEEFQKLPAALDKCIAKGKNVLCIAHAQIKKFEQPDEMGAYDRWELKLQKKTAPLVKEWCDLLLFANFKVELMKSEQDKKKVKAAGGKRRVMYAAHTAAYDAKNRLGLPDEMPFEFASIADAIPSGATAGPSETATAAIESATTASAEAGEPKPKPEAPTMAGVRFEDATPPEFAQLHQLMADYQVSEAQLRDAVGSRKNNPYTDSTPIGEYSIEFVKNTLLKHWEAIVATVKERGDIYKDIPFD